MPEMNRDHVVELLNRILEAELAGVVRYTHYSFLNRIQFESGGLGPCLDARHAHMAAFPEGGFVKTGVTR